MKIVTNQTSKNLSFNASSILLFIILLSMKKVSIFSNLAKITIYVLALYEFHATMPPQPQSVSVQSSQQLSLIHQLGPVKLIEQQGYKVLYSKQFKIPLAVYQTLSANSGEASRKNMRFFQEPKLQNKFRAKISDYVHFYGLLNINRGHMAAAGNYSHNQSQMLSTFSLSNILPQNGNNNQGIWQSFQSAARTLRRECDSVQVVSGPLIKGNPYPVQALSKPVQVPNHVYQKSKQSKLVLNKVQFWQLGQGHVAMPTHLFKIIKCMKSGRGYSSGFIMPNSSDNNNRALSTYQASVQQIQQSTGIQFKEFKGQNLVKENQLFRLRRHDFDRSSLLRKAQKSESLENLIQIDQKAKRKKVGFLPVLHSKLNVAFREQMKQLSDCKAVSRLNHLQREIKQMTHLTRQNCQNFKLLKDQILSRCTV